MRNAKRPKRQVAFLRVAGGNGAIFGFEETERRYSQSGHSSQRRRPCLIPGPLAFWRLGVESFSLFPTYGSKTGTPSSQKAKMPNGVPSRRIGTGTGFGCQETERLNGQDRRYSQAPLSYACSPLAFWRLGVESFSLFPTHGSKIGTPSSQEAKMPNDVPSRRIGTGTGFGCQVTERPNGQDRRPLQAPLSCPWPLGLLASWRRKYFALYLRTRGKDRNAKQPKGQVAFLLFRATPCAPSAGAPGRPARPPRW